MSKTTKESQGSVPAIRLKLSRLSHIKEQKTTWLWSPYLPSGKLTILEGDPSSGKSFLSLKIASHITTGTPFPFGNDSFERPPRNVLMLIGEDGAADTVKPRFRKCGGDMERLILLEGVITTNKDSEDVYNNITLDRIDVLEAALKEVNPALVTVDPFQCYLGENVDMHRSNETRPIMSALSKLAEKYDCAFMLIRHLRKGDSKSIYRGLGSIDILAAARSVLLAGRNPAAENVSEILRTDAAGALLEDKDRFVLVQTKNNLTKKGPSLTYSVDDSGLTLDGESQITDDELLGPPAKPAKPDVDDWLEDFLIAGPKDAAIVKDEAKRLGYGRRKLDGAVARLGIVRRANGFGGSWTWEMPCTRLPDAEGGCTRLDGDPDPSFAHAGFSDQAAHELGNAR